MNLKQMLNLKHNDVLGLDIGSSSVKIIALGRDNSGYKVKAAGLAEITTNPEIELIHSKERNSAVVKAIRDCFAVARLRAKSKLRTNLVVCSVSGPEVAVRDFEFPLLPPEDVEGAVSLEAAQVCPFNADQAEVDFQVIPDNEEKTKGILVAATNLLVTNKVQIAKEAGLKCVLMDIDGLALLNCFHSLDKKEEKSAAAILNVGGSYTTLAVMSDDGWPFIRDTAFAGNNIIAKISAINNCSEEETKQLLFGNSEDSQQLGTSMEKACEELITGVSETLRFYAAQEKSVPIRKIHVCGGFALADGFIELLNRKLGAEVVLWNPFDSIKCDASKGCKEILKTAGPSLAVAAGLALRVI